MNCPDRIVRRMINVEKQCPNLALYEFLADHGDGVASTRDPFHPEACQEFFAMWIEHVPPVMLDEKNQLLMAATEAAIRREQELLRELRLDRQLLGGPSPRLVLGIHCESFGL